MNMTEEQQKFRDKINNNSVFVLVKDEELRHFYRAGINVEREFIRTLLANISTGIGKVTQNSTLLHTERYLRITSGQYRPTFACTVENTPTTSKPMPLKEFLMKHFQYSQNIILRDYDLIVGDLELLVESKPVLGHKRDRIEYSSFTILYDMLGDIP